MGPSPVRGFIAAIVISSRKGARLRGSVHHSTAGSAPPKNRSPRETGLSDQPDTSVGPTGSALEVRGFLLGLRGRRCGGEFDRLRGIVGDDEEVEVRRRDLAAWLH